MRLQTLLAALAFAAADAAALTNPVIFVAQTPNMSGEADIATVTGTFSTHLPSLDAAPRGGSLMILYPDGTLRDLFADAIAAACANSLPTCDLNGAFKVNGSNILTNGYAVREPTVHWDGDKVIFSVLRNVSQAQYTSIPASTRWQIYEISGLGKSVAPVLTKVANQPAEYNNVSPVYGSDDKVFFTSDRPITGNPIHYPQIEEYESGPTVSGLWKLDPATGALTLLDHSPSGLFTPFVDSFGQVLFTRWDHLQQDQQALNAVERAINPSADIDYFRAYTYLSENDVGEAKREFVEDFVRRKTALNTPRNDLQAWGAGETAVPEYHGGHPVLTSDPARVGQAAGIVSGRAIANYTPQNKYGRYDSLRFNLFVPWQINQDGTGHETFRHMGRQDVGMYANQSYLDDPALTYSGSDGNPPMGGRDGFFQLTEYPPSQAPGGGTYVGVASAEFGTHASGFILRMRDTAQQVSENGKAVAFDKLTDPASPTRYRNPVMLSDGTLIAALNTVNPGDPEPNQRVKFRLYRLSQPGGTGFFVPDPQPLVPPGVTRNFNYWSPDALVPFTGSLWEISPVEVRVRARPTAHLESPIPAPELQAFTDAGVDPAQFKQYLRDNDLALIVSRNVTRRDEADRQQPVNLRVEPANVPVGKTGAQTLRTGYTAGQPIYDVAKLQLYQNDLVRGYDGHASGTGASFKDNGRRGLARPMHAAGFQAANPPTPGVPGARIAFDGSFAAFVPAKRAITWTLADKDELPVVRERYWLTFAAGEVRVCASCHGVNQKAQDGGGAATQTPQALRDLLDYWKKSETGVSSILTHYYTSILQRAPDAGGKQYWEDEAVRMRASGSSSNEALFATSASFFASPEYASFNRDDAGFVTDLYNAFFDRAPDGGGLSYWTTQIAGGLPREVVYVSFLFSTEFDTFTRNALGPTSARSEVDTVLDFYRGLLGRLPDPGGLDAWLRTFRQAQCDGAGAVYGAVTSISDAFADSAEYTGRGRSNSQYVGDLYNAFLRRGGDTAGVQYWVGQLNSATLSRAAVRTQFIASPEFNARVQKMAGEACMF